MVPRTDRAVAAYPKMAARFGAADIRERGL